MRKVILLFFINIFFLSLLNASSLRVDSAVLKSNLNGYKIIDARTEDLYLNNHIQGAINFPVDLTFANQQLDGSITDPITMQKLLRNLGLDVHDNIVIYDDSSFKYASRIFWALEVYGFKNVKLLSQGFTHWTQKGYPTSTEIPKVKRSNYISEIDNQRLATKFATLLATRNPNFIIIDARRYRAYLGEISSAKRYGHIPKAINIPAHDNISEEANTTVIKPIETLQSLYNVVPKKKRVILYCSLGIAAATNYFAMRELGYDVSNYDGAWNEWANDFNLAVENPAAGK